MNAAEGILTCRGGMTSHAAVVARGMGKPCVSGSGTIQIDYQSKEFKVGNRVFKEGEIITIDGSSGEVMSGEVKTIKPDISGDFSKIMSWADKTRKMQVRTNAETPRSVKNDQLSASLKENLKLRKKQINDRDNKKIIGKRITKIGISRLDLDSKS